MNSSDSVPYTELEEVVVNGESQWIENGKAVFLPSRQAKHLAADMESMIKIMNTNLLMVKDGVITTSSGEPVAIFINGVPADNVDRSIFWANNVIRVEFYPVTDDPRFHGSRNVLNFVMKEYVAGGVTRVEGSQIFPNDGDYNLASKLVIGKMTYAVKANAGYSRDYCTHYEANESFSDVWYDNSFHDLISRKDAGSSVNRYNFFTTAANARYRTKNFITTHGIAFDWNENPRSSDEGEVLYSPSIIPAGQVNSLSRSRKSSLRLNGEYLTQVLRKWSMSVNWLVRYNHNNQNSSYTESEETPITNFAREDAWLLGMKLRMGYQLSKNIGMAFTVADDYEHTGTTYGGTASSEQKMNMNQAKLSVESIFAFSPKLGLRILPQVALYQRSVNGAAWRQIFFPG